MFAILAMGTIRHFAMHTVGHFDHGHCSPFWPWTPFAILAVGTVRHFGHGHRSPF
jgi:hypothetical protein